MELYNVFTALEINFSTQKNDINEIIVTTLDKILNESQSETDPKRIKGAHDFRTG